MELLVSGPQSKKSLEIYQHLPLAAVESVYQEVVQAIRHLNVTLPLVAKMLGLPHSGERFTLS